MHRRDQHLVTQMIWGRTTHIGCGWTQFPLKDNQNRILKTEKIFERNHDERDI